jgi:hypothetical protein
LPEQALALTHLQIDGELTFQECGQCWAVPQVRRETKVQGTLAQCAFNYVALLWAQPCRPPRTFSIDQAGKSPALKSLNPIDDCVGTVAQIVGDLWARHALRNQQDSMQSMIVSRSLVAPNLVLQRHRHRIIIRNRQGFHAPLTLSWP